MRSCGYRRTHSHVTAQFVIANPMSSYFRESSEELASLGRSMKASCNRLREAEGQDGGAKQKQVRLFNFVSECPIYVRP
jgi:hypothetical protein